MPEEKYTIEQLGQKIKAKYPQYNDIPDSELGEKMIKKFPQYQEGLIEDVKKKEPSAVASEPLANGSENTLPVSQTQEPVSQSPLAPIGDVSQIVDQSKEPLPQGTRNILGLKNVPMTKAGIEANKSIYTLAEEDTDKWYGQAPSPKKKLDAYNQQAAQIKARFQFDLDKGMPADQVEALYKAALSKTANDLGLIFDNGNVSVPQGEIDKYKEVYSRKYEQRAALIADQKKNPYIKDVIGKLGAGSAQLLATPYHLLAINEKLGNAMLSPLGAEGTRKFQDISQYMIENQTKMSEESKRYDEDLLTLVKNGETGKAIGSTVLQAVESLPMLVSLMGGNAMGASGETLAFMGVNSGAQEYMSNSDNKDIGEFAKIVDAFGTGFAEAFFEKEGTMKILDGIKDRVAKDGVNIVQNELTNVLRGNLTRKMMILTQGNADMVREGVSEGLTQLSQNLIAKATVDPGRDIMQGVTDATIVGGAIGKGINLSLNAANRVQTMGKVKAVREAIRQIPEYYSPEAKEKLTPLILERDAIAEATEDASEPIKKLAALKIKAIDDATMKIAAKEEGLELPVEEKPKEGEKKEPEATVPESEVNVSSSGVVPVDQLKKAENDKKEVPPQTENENPEVNPQVNKMDRMKEIEKIVNENGYGLEIEPDTDPNMTTVNVRQGENIIETEALPQGIKDLVNEFSLLTHELKINNNPEDATQIRSDQGQADQGGNVPQESQGNVGPDLQQPKETGAVTGDEKERLNNALVGNIRTYNSMPDTHKNKKADIFKSINNLSQKLGYTISQKNGKIVVSSNGKPIKKITQKRTKSEIESHKSVDEYENQDFKDFVNKMLESDTNFLSLYDTPIGPKDMAKTVQQIRDRKKLATSNDLLDHLEESFNKGYMVFYDAGSREHFHVTIEEILKSIQEAENVDEEFVGRVDNIPNVDEIIDHYEQGTLTPEEMNALQVELTDEEYNLLKDQYEDEQQNRRAEEENGSQDEEVDQPGRAETEKQAEENPSKEVNYDIKSPNDKVRKGQKEYIIIEETVFKNSDLKDGIVYNPSGDTLIEDKPSNRHIVKGEKYFSNGTPFDALQLREDVNKLPKVVDPQTQVLNLALDELKISIPEYKQKIEVNGQVKRIPSYTGEGLAKYRQSVREFLDQIPQLSKAVSDVIIEKWYYEQLSIQLKNRNEGDLNSIGAFVHDKNVEDALAYFDKPTDEEWKAMFPDRESRELSMAEDGGYIPDPPMPEQTESPEAKVVRGKLDAEITDQEKLLKEAKIRKNQKIAEFNNRNGMFGDVKNETEPPKLFETKTEFSQDRLNAFIQPEVNEIARLEKKIAKLKTNKEAKVKEAAGQVVMEEESFAQPSKGKGKKKAKTPPNTKTTIAKPSNPTENKTQEGPEKRWIDEDKMTNEGLKGIEAPELIKLIKMLSGKFPSLKNFKKKLGVFYHMEGGDSSIALDRKLFTKEGIDLLAKVIAHELGHFFDFLPDKTMKRGNILGRIASLKEYFTKTLGEKPGREADVLTDKDRAYLRKEAEAALKEEYNKGIREIIEEVIKEEPIYEESGLTAADILSIWNDNHARENNPELYEFIAKLSAIQKKKIVAAALKGLIDSEIAKRFSKSKQIGVKITKEFIKKTITPKPIDNLSIAEKYRELLRKEINKRKLFQDEVIRQELEDLTMWWNPYDENLNKDYTKYRKSGKELYAEAISVLLNNPQALAERAPFFNRAFMNYFQNKPTVKQAFDEIQELLSKPKEVLQQDRLFRIYEGYKKGEAKRQEIAKREKKPLLSKWDRAMRDYVSMIIPIIKKIPEPKQLFKSLNDRQKVRDALEKLAFANEKVAVMLVQMHSDINLELEKAGLSVDDFGALLEVERNLGQRTDIANPYAFQEKASAELKAFIESRFNDKQKDVMDRVIKTFHDRVFEIISVAHDAGMFTPEQFAHIEKFKDSYATYQVVDYIEKNRVASGFKKATGTIKEVESPYISTLFKMASVIKDIERQNAVNVFKEAWHKYHPKEIKDSEKRMIKGVMVGFKNEEGKGRIEYWDNGKWSGLDVDPYIADFFDRTKSSDMSMFITLLHYFNKGFKPMVTTWNVGWAFFSNIFRDHPRTFYNLFAILASTEGVSKLEAAKMPATYLKSLIQIFPQAKKFVNGELTPLIEDMINQGVLRHGFFGSYDPYSEESVGPVFQSAGMIKKDKSMRDRMAEASRIVKFGLRILGAIEYGGQVLEVSSKMAGFNLLKKKLGSSESAGFYTRNYAGTPNYMDKGTQTRTTNEVLTFSNVILQAIRTDSEIAFKPQTAGAFWLSQAMNVITPAALMAFACAGLFGKRLEELYAQITEYEKTNYLCIVLGETREGKPVYTKIPIADFSKVIHGVTYKTLSNVMDHEGFTVSDIGQILSPGASMTPSPSPILKTALGWGQYMAGKNPYDFFYGKNVLTDREQDARHDNALPSLGKMMNWTIKNIGGTWIVKLYDYDATKNSTTEYTLSNLPVISRMIKIGGYGNEETMSRIGSEIRSEKAAKSLKLDKTINKYVLEALREGKDLTNSKEVVDELKKEIYGKTELTPEENREFSYTKKKFKTKLIKGVRSPFSNTVSSIIDSKSNDEKVAKLQEYALIYGEDKFIDLINYLDDQGLVSRDLKNKTGKMIEGIDLDENKRNTIIEALDYQSGQSGESEVPTEE